MNKPTIPNEVADVIENLRDPESGHIFSNAEIASVALRTGGGLPLDTKILQTISFDTLMAALVNGYERELTEEQRHQKIKEQYELYRLCAGHYDTSHEDAAHADGIRHTLNMLGIQIEGVNA